MELTRLKKRFAPRLTLPSVPFWSWFVIAALVTVLLLAWEYSSRTRAISSLLYPPPSLIGKTLIRWFTTLEWQDIVLPTLGRLVVGFSFGTAIGYVFGIALGYSRPLARVIDPILSFIYPMPKISLLPLALVIFGLGDTPRYIIIALGAFFPMVINTTAGVRMINSNYLAISSVYRARLLTVFRRILLPGSLPMAVTGMRIAFNSAFVVTVAIELNGATNGLGYVVWLSWQTMRTQELYAGIFVIALIGVAATALLKIAERTLIPWQQ